MNITKENYKKMQVSKEEVESYLARLKYALDKEDTIIKFQENRQVDTQKSREHTNKYTIAELFPDESPKDVLRRELRSLKVSEYMETVKDLKFSKRSNLWVFGKKYNLKDTYIKFRVEIVS